MTDNPLLQSPIKAADEKPLESWKEIAAYVKRDVRTVKRWEKAEGLPVRRHMHLSRSSVYAYPSELDAWWAARSPRLERIAQPSVWSRVFPRVALAAIVLLSLSALGDRSPSVARAAPQRAGPTLTEIFSGQPSIELDSHGRFSPDGKRLASTDSGYVVVVDVETGKRTRLTDSNWDSIPSAFAQGPVWSPDGTRIAFALFVESRCELRVVPAKGGQAQVLFGKDNECFYLNDWSPDGKQILGWLRHAGGESSLAMVSTSGDVTELRVWEKELGAGGSAVFAPDGRHVAYSAPLGGSNPLFLLNLETRAEIPMSSPKISDRFPVWSRDGRTLLFVSDRSGRWDLWALSVRDGKPEGDARSVYSDVGDVRTMIGWDGQDHLVFTRQVTFGQLYSVGVDPSSGATLTPPTRPIAQLEGKHMNAMWSPDGKRVALTANTRERGAIYVVETGSGDFRELNTRTLGWAGLAGWLPSGDGLVLSAMPTFSTVGFYLVRLAGGPPETLHEDSHMIWATGRLSPDGTTAAYFRSEDDPKGMKLRILDLKSKQAIREVTFSPDENYYIVSWAPDGRAVYCLLGQRVLRVPLPSGEPQEIVKQGFRALAVSPDGRTLAVTRVVPAPERAKSEPRYQLYVVNANGGEPKKVQLPEGHNAWRVRWAPDGKIGYISQRAKSQFMRLSDFLPALNAVK